MRGFIALIRCDLRLSWRAGGGGLAAAIFFLTVVLILPLAIGPDRLLLARLAPGVIWIAALLAGLLSLDRLFHDDHRDGMLDVIAAAPIRLETAVLAKCAAHWIATGLVLCVIAPLPALMLGFDAASLPILLATLVIGTPALSLTGAVGAALTPGARRGGLLAGLLVIPWTIPVVIFAVAAVRDGGGPALMLLGAVTLAAGALAPVAAAAALRLRDA